MKPLHFYPIYDPSQSIIYHIYSEEVPSLEKVKSWISNYRGKWIRKLGVKESQLKLPSVTTLLVHLDGKIEGPPPIRHKQLPIYEVKNKISKLRH